MRLAMLALAAALAAFGQNRPVRAVGRITSTTFAGNLAASVQGTLPTRPVRFPPFVLLGGGYGGYGYPDPAYMDPSMFAPPVPMAPPVLVIHTEPPYPPAPELPNAPAPIKTEDNSVKIYSNPVTMAPPDAPAKPSAGGQVVILALKDGGAEMAIAYWTDGNQLKYVTPDRKQEQIPLAKVDAALSTRLNRERGVSFSLTKVE
ncbi:MAG TPA: hypothetical protein VG168_06445 [Bryobacteraceae bacterium]|nr:hypothetical protein [Bryobacteraceae bacterium]